MPRFICNKLSRDKTLENMQRNKITATHRMLIGKEFVDALHHKLMEEALEVTQATERQEIIAELADVLEVMDGLCSVYAISFDEIQAIKASIKEQRGGFQNGLFVGTIEMAEENPSIQNFRKAPEKYLELS